MRASSWKQFTITALAASIVLAYHLIVDDQSTSVDGNKETVLRPHYKTKTNVAPSYRNAVIPPPFKYTMRQEDNALPANFQYQSRHADPPIFLGDHEIKEGNYPASNFTLHLVGERHTGTNWMTDHLSECFGGLLAVEIQPRFTRWKHWFQEDQMFGPKGPKKREQWTPKKSVVVAQFRNPYDWVKAMIKYPYHSPEHLELPWLEFVNRPWHMNPYGEDVKWGNLSSYTKGSMQEAPCQAQYYPNEVVPCLDFRDDIIVSKGLSHPYSIHALYELRRDGSGKSYQNVLEMRADKIRNMMSMRNFKNIHHFVAVQYEGVATHGTEKLIRHLETVLGVKAKCEPSEGKFHPRSKEPEFIDYLNRHMDWEAEELVGYHRIDPFS